MISAVIVDAEKQDRDRTTALLSAEETIKILACGKDGYDALKLTGSFKPDIVIVDNQLEFIDGGDIPPLLKARSPFSMVAILTRNLSDHQLYRAASNRVSGFIDKETDMGMLPDILRYISGGGCFISPAFAARVLNMITLIDVDILNKRRYTNPLKKSTPDLIISSREDPAGYLSKMELNLLTQLGKGLPSVEIASKLGLTAGTVNNYASSLMNKLGLRSRAQIVRYVFNNALVLPEKKPAIVTKELKK